MLSAVAGKASPPCPSLAAGFAVGGLHEKEDGARGEGTKFFGPEELQSPP